MATYAQFIASFATRLQIDDVPVKTLRVAKLHLLDTLGCGLAARAVGQGAFATEAVQEVVGTHPARSSLILNGLLVPAAGAALANAVLCHTLDFDDTHLRSMCHVGTVICPAALAAAESEGLGGKDALLAVIIGTEVTARLGSAVASAYMKQGFHPTSVCGVFGAALASARLFECGEAATVRALGIAGGMASGNYEYLADGSDTEASQAGWAAHGGIVAARLAKHGGGGPASVLEGRFGVLGTYFRLDPGLLEAELHSLGGRWETDLCAVKPYPAAHLVHPCLDAARLLIQRTSISPDEVEEVIVSIPEPGVKLVLEPRADKVAPRTEVAARFSLPYSMAAMLVLGEVGLDAYSPANLSEPRVLDLARRIRYEPAGFEARPGSLPARVVIRTRDGRVFAAERDSARGGPEDPMSEEEIIGKFRHNAALALDRETSDTMVDWVMNLEREQEVGRVNRFFKDARRV